MCNVYNLCSESFEEGSQYSGSSQISHADRFMYKIVVKGVSLY